MSIDRVLVHDVDPYTADDDDLPRWRRAIGIDGPPPAVSVPSGVGYLFQRLAEMKR